MVEQTSRSKPARFGRFRHITRSSQLILVRRVHLWIRLFIGRYYFLCPADALVCRMSGISHKLSTLEPDLLSFSVKTRFFPFHLHMRMPMSARFQTKTKSYSCDRCVYPCFISEGSICRLYSFADMASRVHGNDEGGAQGDLNCRNHGVLGRCPHLPGALCVVYAPVRSGADGTFAAHTTRSIGPQVGPNYKTI